MNALQRVASIGQVRDVTPLPLAYKAAYPFLLLVTFLDEDESWTLTYLGEGNYHIHTVDAPLSERDLGEWEMAASIIPTVHALFGLVLVWILASTWLGFGLLLMMAVYTIVCMRVIGEIHVHNTTEAIDE